MGKNKGVATLLEWDGDIPVFDLCLAELHKARDYMQVSKNTKLYIDLMVCPYTTV